MQTSQQAHVKPPITQEEYFYIEWLIIEKQMTAEKYSSLENREKNILLKEYLKFKNR